jgi:plasmid stabilization system protein ParE
MRIRILDEAERDLEDGRQFYEKQRAGLGIYFLDTLFADIESLHLYAGIHRIFFGQYHRLLSKRFPFAVYYTVSESTVLIHAVLDCRRNPSWIRTRLK